MLSTCKKASRRTSSISNEIDFYGVGHIIINTFAGEPSAQSSSLTYWQPVIPSSLDPAFIGNTRLKTVVLRLPRTEPRGSTMTMKLFKVLIIPASFLLTFGSGRKTRYVINVLFARTRCEIKNTSHFDNERTTAIRICRRLTNDGISIFQFGEETDDSSRLEAVEKADWINRRPRKSRVQSLCVHKWRPLDGGEIHKISEGWIEFIALISVANNDVEWITCI